MIYCNSSKRRGSKNASINELKCLANIENLNAVFIQKKMPQKERLIKLYQIAIQQMKVLVDAAYRK